VGLIPVQVKRDTHDGDLGGDQKGQYFLTQAKVKQAILQKVDKLHNNTVSRVEILGIVHGGQSGRLAFVPVKPFHRARYKLEQCDECGLL